MRTRGKRETTYNGCSGVVTGDVFTWATMHNKDATYSFTAMCMLADHANHYQCVYVCLPKKIKKGGIIETVGHAFQVKWYRRSN